MTLDMIAETGMDHRDAPPPAADWHDGVALYSADLDAPPAAGSAPCLSEDERARAARFHFPRDGSRFAAARTLLRTVLGHWTGVPADTLRFTYGPRGKPALPGGPEFNLSHSAGVAVLAVSRSGPVGVDVERLDRSVDPMGLGQAVFDPEELAVLAGLSPAQRCERFFAFWTAKEARMKLTGEGMSLPPRSIRLALAEGWPTGFVAPRARPVSLSRPPDAPPGTIVSLACFADPAGGAG